MKKHPRVWWLAVALLLASGGASLRAETPAEPKKNGYTVETEVVVDEQGKPESVALLSSEDQSAGEFLTKMAVAMAARSEFPPRLKDGKPVKYKARMPFFFPIPDDEGPAINEQPRPRVRKDGVIQPAYPLAEAKAGEVGGAVLEIIVGADGNVTSAKVMRASKPVFGAAALQGVKQWKFIPAMAGETPVETRWRLAVVFESSKKMMEDYTLRVPPRPSFGTFVVGHNEDVPENATPKAEDVPAATTPAK